jgi:hypothetical protein
MNHKRGSDNTSPELVYRVRLTNYTVDAPSGGAEFSIL